MPEDRQYLCFHVGQQVFGVPFLRLAEVRTLTNATPVLAAPDYGSGFVVLHGRQTPVFDLRIHFGLPGRLDGDTRLIVIWRQRPGFEDTPVGLLVDRMEQLVTIDETEIVPPPDFGDQVATSFIRGTVPLAGGCRILLDVDRLLES